MGVSFAPFLIFLLTGFGIGGNHLLDYAATESYWKGKNVAVSVESMLAELKVPPAADISEFLKKLGSPDAKTREEAAGKILAQGRGAIPQLEQSARNPDPQVAASSKSLIARLRSGNKPADVRRLMAIRTLGELKKADALPLLRSLLDSKEMFIAEYATRAIASIEGNPFVWRKLTPEQRDHDLWLLPADVRLVAQHAGLPGGTTTLEQLIDQVWGRIPAGIGGQPLPDKTKIIDDLTGMVVSLAEKIGDVRFDGMTAGVSGAAGPDDGFVVVIVRGEYDSAAVTEFLLKQKFESKQSAGLEFIHLDDNAAAALPGNDLLIFTAGASPEKLPLEALGTALTAGNGGLADVKEMKALIARAERDKPLWGAALVSDEMRQNFPDQPFDAVFMSAHIKNDILHFQMTGEGKDADKVKGFVNLTNATLQAFVGQFKNNPVAVMFKPLIDVVDSIKITADGPTAKLAGEVNKDTITMITGFFFGSMPIGERAQPPQQLERAKPRQ